MNHRNLGRRELLRKLGVSAAAIPFLSNLPSIASAAKANRRKQRLVIMFSPNGTIPDEFWPDQEGSDFELKRILAPLEPYKDRLLTLHGICNKVKGDGDSHMRGMSCLLTGTHLFPGNIQGGSHTPAGWASGISIDQEIKNFLQSNPETQTRFGELLFGVNVGDRADPWTRLSYAGPNKPVAPIEDPYRMFEKMYGRVEDQATIRSVLDSVQEDLRRVRGLISREDRRLLDEHESFVREMEKELKAGGKQTYAVSVPELESGVKNENDNAPLLGKMQIELMVNGLANDMNRVAVLQYTKSVGGARMNWLGIDENHHSLSHEPDDNKAAKEKLVKINTWFCEQLVYLAKRLDETPEPGGQGSLLDNTTIVWTNELGKGNSHTLNNIPFVMLGGGLGFKMGRSLKYNKQNHNRLLAAIANGMGHEITTFGDPNLCSDGVLTDLS
ncbi:DUF1552 domain-containing protein [Rosistilla oblonga]|uniref:DUF1552 domain-containing protein n=1 Tax=Rosistilla oblonga TaxID=2527990 RepID=UPI003A97A95F